MASLRRKLPSAHALFVFEAAARCGNFTKAAAELYVTQPAVSRMLARLEDHMGVRLFERGASGLTLTENGELLYQRVSEGFRGIEAAIQEIEARNSGTDTVSLSVSTAFTTHWLMPRMHKLHEALPSVDLRFQLIAGPIRGPVEDVDLGMRFVSGDDVDHRATLIIPEILVPVCSPAYREHALRESDEGDGFGDTLISLSESPTDWFSHFPSFQRRSNRPTNSLLFSDYAVVLQAALLGQGVAVGWLNVVCHWLNMGALVPAQKDVVVTGRLCHIIRSRKRPLRPAVSDVIDWILEQTKADLAQVDEKYPELGVPELVQGGFK